MLAVTTVLTAATCAGAPTPVSTPVPVPVKHEVQMRAVSFAPRELTIHLGDTVLFKNADIVRHNATRRDVFETGDLRTGESYSWVPADTGSFRYQCTIHSRMRGEVKVAPQRTRTSPQ
jgi:plastocyanin